MGCPRSLLLLGCFFLLAVNTCLAANSTLCAEPGIQILSPSGPQTYLIVDRTCFTYDLLGNFYLNISTYYKSQTISGDLPVATLVGTLTFQQPGLILFSYENDNTSYCIQARSSPPLCPYLQTLTEGPFVFGAYPETGNIERLTIQSSTANPNPKNPSGPLNFLGATQPITFTCSGTCASLGDQVPPAPLPQNGSFSVRRSPPSPTSALLLLVYVYIIGIKYYYSKNRVSLREWHSSAALRGYSWRGRGDEQCYRAA